MIRLLAVFTMGMVDTGAAFLLGGVWCGLIVLLAAGWASAQHDSGYGRQKR